MITAPDFAKKQILFVMTQEGEKLAILNDNLIINDKEGKTKFQITCYRIYLVFVMGNTSITTVLIQKAKKYGFYIALMTTGFHLYSVIGAPKDGNTLLKERQYNYTGYDLARHIARNKILNQQAVLKAVRNKNIMIKDAIPLLEKYADALINPVDSVQTVMAYEGLASKLYFRNHFNTLRWNGRQPRLKRDYLNSTLDIGYTVLFSFIEALLETYGFDTYKGVMHTQFYMRKSLVCDIVEPFRPIIDTQIKKCINLKQIKEEDFKIVKQQYQLRWEHNSRYVRLLMEPIIKYKMDIFSYVQSYYRAFMKGLPEKDFPIFEV